MSSNNIRPEMQNLLIQAATGAIKGILHGEVVVQSCLSCVHFKEPQEICNLYNMRPPARIIAKACPDYMDNLEVPF
jgi:hypothetical protein